MPWTSQTLSKTSRRLRITLVMMSNLAWLLAFVIMGTGNEVLAERIPPLIVLGVLWRLMAYAWPERWMPGGAQSTA